MGKLGPNFQDSERPTINLRSAFQPTYLPTYQADNLRIALSSITLKPFSPHQGTSLVVPSTAAMDYVEQRMAQEAQKAAA